MMLNPGHLLRVISIGRILARHGFDEILFTLPLLKPLRFVRYLLPWNWTGRHYGPRGPRLRAVLEDLGPLFVKFGQLLSTRRDLLAEDVAEELAKLQDNVPPFPGAQARAIVERAYGKSVTEVFAAFDETSLASASIAQVHVAQLHDGREVIVKVVRPGIRRVIERDIALMRFLADLAENYWARGRLLKPTLVVNEFEKTILDELDMLREAANASQLRRNFAASPRLYVPEVHWALSRPNLLVLERIDGISISNVAALRAANIDLSQLAASGVELFFTQVFRDHFFHADLHPGNLFVRPGVDGADPVFVVVDFGIMGSLSEFDQRYLAENFYAFLNRDYRRVAELHVESGWVPRDTRVDDFEFAIRTVCEPIFDRPVSDISVGQLLLRLFQTAQRFHMEILPQLLLLQKTLVSVEGIGRQLDPELDLWRTARPSLESWMKDRVGIRSLLRSTRENVPRWIDRLPELPGLAFDVLDRIKQGRIEVATHDEMLQEIRQEIRTVHRRLSHAVVGAALVLAAAFFYAVPTAAAGWWGPLPSGVWLLGGAGLVILLGAANGRRG